MTGISTFDFVAAGLMAHLNLLKTHYGANEEKRMSGKIEISREQLARIKDELVRGNGVSRACAADELRALLAAPVVEPSQCDLVTGDVVCTRPRGHSGRCLMLERKVFGATVVERQPVPSDIVHDKAYRNGMMAGFSFGIRGDEDGYAQAVERYDDEIHAAKAERPAPVAVVLPEQIELVAQTIYQQWADRAGFVRWVPRGNSIMQDEARSIARGCLDKVKELNQ